MAIPISYNDNFLFDKYKSENYLLLGFLYSKNLFRFLFWLNRLHKTLKKIDVSKLTTVEELQEFLTLSEKTLSLLKKDFHILPRKKKLQQVIELFNELIISAEIQIDALTPETTLEQYLIDNPSITQTIKNIHKTKKVNSDL